MGVRYMTARITEMLDQQLFKDCLSDSLSLLLLIIPSIRTVQQACGILCIEFIDHIIVSRTDRCSVLSNSYYSQSAPGKP